MIGMHGKVSSGLAVDNADVLIAIGARFSDRVATKPTDFAKSATIIHIDIDRTEIDKNVPSQMKLLGDVGKALARLIPQIKPCDRTEWLAQVNAWRAQDLVPAPCEDHLRPYQLIRAISDKLGPEGVLVTDVGQHQMWAAQYADRSRPRSFLTSGGLGTMGFGYGAAVGAQVGCPDRRVVLVTGDGSFHMNLNELATAVSENLPVVTVVFNNGVLGMVRQWQTLFYDKRYSCTSPERKTDFVKLAEAFGAKGLPAEFSACLEEAFLHDGPSVIDCRVDKDEMVLPMIATGKTIKEVLVC
jgi:acetolactate synthase-1/2/3 large subunit